MVLSESRNSANWDEKQVNQLLQNKSYEKYTVHAKLTFYLIKK